MKRIFAALTGLVAMTGAAFAADVYRAPTMKDSTPGGYVEARQAFQGGYVGATVNWGDLDVQNTTSLNWEDCESGCDRRALRQFFDTGDVDSVTLPGRGFDGDGIGGGVRAGYHFRLGRVYGGPLLSLDFGKVDAKDAFSIGDLDVEHRASIDWSGTLAAKLGVVVTERIGVYALVGTTFADVSVSGRGTVDSDQVGSYSGSELAGGLTYGAGVDLMITEQLSVFAEWTRTEFGNVNAGGTALDCIGVDVDTDLVLDVAKVGLAYHF